MRFFKKLRSEKKETDENKEHKAFVKSEIKRLQKEYNYLSSNTSTYLHAFGYEFYAFLPTIPDNDTPEIQEQRERIREQLDKRCEELEKLNLATPIYSIQ